VKLRHKFWRIVGHFTFMWFIARSFLLRRWEAFRDGCRALYRRWRPLKPQQIQFPLFEIASNPTIQLSEIKARRFSIIDRGETFCAYECCRCGWYGEQYELSHIVRGQNRCPTCLSTNVECVVDEKVVEGDIILYREVQISPKSCV
jgi:hypothetical protein